MIAHVGSTPGPPLLPAHPARRSRRRSPGVVTVYGGVYPDLPRREILSQHPEVDVVVRGEGEATAARAGRRRWPVGVLRRRRPVGRRGHRLAPTAAGRRGQSGPGPIDDLDAYPIGWDLIEDWDRYRAFGLGRAAVVQFSRGCPHTCTYCGQWMFWKRWRHRDVDEVRRRARVAPPRARRPLRLDRRREPDDAQGGLGGRAGGDRRAATWGWACAPRSGRRTSSATRTSCTSTGRRASSTS